MANEIGSLPAPFRISRLLANYRSEFFTLAPDSQSIAADPMTIVPLVEFGLPFRRCITEELAKSEYSPHVVIIGANCSGRFNSEWVEMVHSDENTQFFRERSTYEGHSGSEWLCTDFFEPRLGRLAEVFARILNPHKIRSDCETFHMGGSGAMVYLAERGRLSEFHFDLSDWSFLDSAPQRWIRFFLTGSRLSLRFWSLIL